MKSIIDKKNPLWKWKKADKQVKKWYKEICGLDAEYIGIMSPKGYALYEKLKKKLSLSHKEEEK